MLFRVRRILASVGGRLANSREQARCLGVLDRLLVNQVFWGSRTENGGNFEPHYSSRQIDSANQFLDRLYQRVSADIPSKQFLRFDHGLMTGSVTHIWGISPFHYVDAYYHATIRQLTVSSASYLHAAGSSEAQLPGVSPVVLSEKQEKKL